MMNWFWLHANVDKYVAHIAADPYFWSNLHSLSIFTSSSTTLILPYFAGGTCDLFLCEKHFIVRHCCVGVTISFFNFVDTVMDLQHNSVTVSICIVQTSHWEHLGAKLARVTERSVCRSDFVLRRHIIRLETICRYYEGSRSSGSAHLLIPSRMITSFTAEFLAKFLLTMSKTHALQLAFIINTERELVY